VSIVQNETQEKKAQRGRIVFDFWGRLPKGEKMNGFSLLFYRCFISFFPLHSVSLEIDLRRHKLDGNGLSTKEAAVERLSRRHRLPNVVELDVDATRLLLQLNVQHLTKQ